MITRLPFLFALLAVPAAPLVAQEQPAPASDQASPGSQLEIAAAGMFQVLTGKRPAAEVFAPSFLAQVSETRLLALTAQLTEQYGALTGIEDVRPSGPTTARVSLRFERAIASGEFRIADTAPNQVTEFLIRGVQPTGDSVADVTAALERLPGEVSVLYAPLDRRKEPILAHNADAQLAIGSTFKLYVLSALAQQVERGARAWDDVVPLDTRSLPSGVLQAWPQGAPMTLHTLASLMISISDNTATDQLIHLLGRAALNEEVVASGHSAPAGMLPFLTTLEAFGYKGDPTRAGSYAMASEDQQGVLLEAFAQEIARDPSKITLPRLVEPTMIDSIEWLASANDIRRIMERLAALEDPTARQIMAISPSIPEPARGEWAYIGYKGGSEPGVLNLSWLLQSPEGEWYVLAMSWNDPQAPVDNARFELLVQRLLSLPRP